MAHLHTQAAQRGTPRLWADVSLTAEPFFARHGFAVEARQQVERHGVVLRNTRMAKLLAGNCS
jgi:putative acetyltransferase